MFPLPEALIPEDTGTLPGIDGKTKMSKSLGNAIFLSDDEKTMRDKVMKMYTDPTRIHPTDPGHVEGNPVFTYLDAFAFGADKVKVEDLKEKYKKGKVGDIQVKQFLAQVLNQFLKPIREKRAQLEKESGLVEKILADGTKRTREEARRTLDEVRNVMGLV